ncbi:MAG: hypothetical protein AAGK00_17785 [Pseudomonadota bacterium]
MLLKETTPAAVTPVPLDEFADHLRLGHGFVDDGSQNGLLDLYLRNATAVVERRTGQALIRRPYQLQSAGFDRHGHLSLPVGPVSTIDGFRYVTPGSTITLDPEDWVLEPGTARQRITGPGGGPLWAMPMGAVAEVDFQAGYGLAWTDIPDDLTQAVILLAAHYYENRFGDAPGDDGIPYGVLAIVESHRAVRL